MSKCIDRVRDRNEAIDRHDALESLIRILTFEDVLVVQDFDMLNNEFHFHIHDLFVSMIECI